MLVLSKSDLRQKSSCESMARHAVWLHQNSLDQPWSALQVWGAVMLVDVLADA
jgi:hypothetical protein